MDCWAALLLIVFLARAMVPVGFMPATTTDGFQLIVCQGTPSDLPSSDPAHPGAPGAHHDLACPFSLSAAGGPAPTAPLSASILPLSLERFIADPVSYRPVRVLPRHTSPRGPPQFA